MNNDLISRSALLGIFLRYPMILHHYGDFVAVNVDAVIAEVRRAPAVDAVEVVHGRCDYCKDGKSFIGQTIMIANDGKCHTIRYCPNCGAKMDLEEHE